MNSSKGLPPGFDDEHVEFFVKDLKLFAVYNGSINRFEDLPSEVTDRIGELLEADIHAQHVLVDFREEEKLEQFAFCKFGGYNQHADLLPNGDTAYDHWDCPLRGTGQCTIGESLCPRPALMGAVVTRREREVAQLTAEGLLDKEIADRLGIAPNTVHVHMRSLREKTGLLSKTDITREVIHQNL